MNRRLVGNSRVDVVTAAVINYWAVLKPACVGKTNILPR